MEADVIAARVLEAMRENRFHIFTHPEFKDELRELFDEILQDFRDYPRDPGFEQRDGLREDAPRELQAAAKRTQGAVDDAGQRTRPRKYHHSGP